ncbi:MAG: sulfite exporter TauE/SafE family protein [Nitrospirota bacterium]
MSDELLVLISAAASIGFFHTLLGPDHYLPFIVMHRAGKWSLRKTAFITAACGIGHVLSSILLGIIGIALGIALSEVAVIESFRGGIAAWALVAFGLVYFVWGVRRAIRNRPHKHLHIHEDGSNHIHTHTHADKHLHIHEKKSAGNFSPWMLLTIFILGPCEPLIPLLMYPAAKSSLMGLIMVTAVFGAVTLATMLGIVLVSTLGINFIPLKPLERYTHAFAGAAICMSGLAIHFLGL